MKKQKNDMLLQMMMSNDDGQNDAKSNDDT